MFNVAIRKKQIQGISVEKLEVWKLENSSGGSRRNQCQICGQRVMPHCIMFQDVLKNLHGVRRPFVRH